MNTRYLTLGSAVVLAGLLATSAPTAMAIPPDGTEPIITCPRGYVLIDDICVKLPPPPPSNSPVVQVGLAQQTTNTQAIRVNGRATDADQPATALTVHISVDGVHKRTVTANLPDDVLTQYYTTAPPVNTGHRYDDTVAAPAGAQNVCVTAVNVGSTGANTKVCKAVDNVVEFSGNSLSYDVAKAELKNSSAEELDRIDHTNNTTVQQSTSITGTKTKTKTFTWSTSTTLKVSYKTSVGIPAISKSEITFEGSFNFSTNSTNTTTETFTWQQPVIVPAQSRVVGTVAVTNTQLVVPYKIVGDYVYDSGLRVPGSEGGLFTGVDGHDLEVRIDQFDLDGTPAARAADQPQARMLQG